jgi:hypothetical protein
VGLFVPGELLPRWERFTTVAEIFLYLLLHL